MIVLNHIISIARNTGLLPFNPFVGYINSPESLNRRYLTRKEIQRLIEAPMKNKTYELVRDLFVFSIFTGLPYADVKNSPPTTYKHSLTETCGSLPEDGRPTPIAISGYWMPNQIIEKYKGLTGDNRVFPVPSNSSCNEKLENIGKQCGIKTRLTYHMRMHSADTTILLPHGIPIETVTRILGHTNIKTTQIYARITKQKISWDMETLSHKLEDMEKNICEAI